MDFCTPPSRRSGSRLRSKTASRLILQSSDEFGENHPPNLTLSPPKKFPSPQHLSPQASSPVPLHEVLLLSPSPLRRSKHRSPLLDAGEELLDQVSSRRKCRSRAVSSGSMGCASPRSMRPARRRLEHESREERDLGLGEESGRLRKTRPSRNAGSRREKLRLVPSVPSIPSPSLSPKNDGGDWSSLDSIRQTISELIMWEDIAKSTLWFGFGSLFFVSSCFARGISFSIISAISQLALLFLAMAFFYNTFSQRGTHDRVAEFKLKEEDIVRVARAILPLANGAIAMTRELFSGEPSMTLKMATILIFASEYGHLITPWRLFATGFFFSFTVPKLYSRYSFQINRPVEYLRFCLWDAWEACPHKRIVAASTATVLWNLSTVKTRIFAAFISMVILQYCRQQSAAEVGGEEEGEQQLALVISKQKDPTMVDYK